jgi:hypothetical protein
VLYIITFKEVCPMWEISASLLLKAQEAAKKMNEEGLELSSVPFGQKDAIIFVSSNPALVKGTDEFELDGKKFFVGTKP